MDKNLLLKNKNIDSFCRKYNIISLALFGSILGPSFTSKSDIDFLVQFERQHIPSLLDLVDMEAELSAIIGRHADLKTPNDLSPYFRNEVIAQAEVIYVQK